MNYREAEVFARDKFIPLITQKFKEVWGEDVFLHNLCKDEETYRNTNGSMYKHYMRIVNGLLGLPETPKYKRCYDGSEPEYQYVQRMYDDFAASEDPLKWMMEFIPPNY